MYLVQVCGNKKKSFDLARNCFIGVVKSIHNAQITVYVFIGWSKILLFSITLLGIYAYITLKEDITESEEDIIKQLRALVKKKIAGYAVPEIVQVCVTMQSYDANMCHLNFVRTIIYLGISTEVMIRLWKNKTSKILFIKIYHMSFNHESHVTIINNMIVSNYHLWFLFRLPVQACQKHVQEKLCVAFFVRLLPIRLT